MMIGKGIVAGGKTVPFASEDGKSFSAYDPSTRTAGRALEIERIAAPVIPGKIIAVGLNYRDHAREMALEIPSEPILFMKPSSSVIGPDETIRYPAQSSRVDYEAELAAVIGKKCCNVSSEEAYDYVLGYTCANDVSARIWQLEKGDGQWCRGKSFDTFGPLGPVLVLPEEIGNPDDLAIKTTLNGNVVQQSSTANMVRSVGELISFLSQDTTLMPGTIILTGTPEGVGWAREPKLLLQKGDTVCVEVENIGVLENPVE